MKRLFISLLFFISVSAIGQTADEMEVRKILTRQNEAWNRGDLDAFMEGYWENDSLMFIGSSGITYGYKNTLANYKKRYPDTQAMGTLTFTLIRVRQLSPEYCLVTGQWHLQRSIGDAGGFFTLVFRKINRQWVIISDHSS